MRSLVVYLALVCILALSYAVGSAAGDDQRGERDVVFCTLCNGTVRRCGLNQICCTGLTGGCTSGSTCPPVVDCASKKCGIDCAGAAVYCPVGYYCCNSCTGANICKLPGETCIQDCPTCPPAK